MVGAASFFFYCSWLAVVLLEDHGLWYSGRVVSVSLEDTFVHTHGAMACCLFTLGFSTHHSSKGLTPKKIGDAPFPLCFTSGEFLPCQPLSLSSLCSLDISLVLMKYQEVRADDLAEKCICISWSRNALRNSQNLSIFIQLRAVGSVFGVQSMLRV